MSVTLAESRAVGPRLPAGAGLGLTTFLTGTACNRKHFTRGEHTGNYTTCSTFLLLFGVVVRLQVLVAGVLEASLPLVDGSTHGLPLLLPDPLVKRSLEIEY